MPPASFAWSPNNSAQQNSNIGGGGGILTVMNSDHDVIGSLGKALSSSVNLGEADNLTRGGGGHSNLGQQHQQATGVGEGRYGAPITTVAAPHTGSWTGLSEAVAAPDPMPQPGLSYNYYNSNNGSNTNRQSQQQQQAAAPVKTTNEHDSLQNILYDSGIYEKEEVANHRRASVGTLRPQLRPHTTGGSNDSCNDGAPRRPSTPAGRSSKDGTNRERKPSIDIFLSQSPSKTLGEDAFRIHMHRTNSNPSLDLYHHENPTTLPGGGAARGLKPLASTAPSSRSESPTQTARSSTGGSPYNANGGGVAMGMYNPVLNTFSPGGGNVQQQASNPSSQYSTSCGNVSSVNNGQQQASQASQPVVQQVQPQVQSQQQQYIPIPVAQQQPQPQVFYMAVPAPDGKGQVLQPVQMVQMPGQPGALMMPVATSNTNSGNQGVGGGDPQGQVPPGQGGVGNGQPMMLMQSVQQAGGATNNGMANGMYGQETGNGSGYNQYGNIQHHQQQLNGAGYDTYGIGMNRIYQSKHSNCGMVDNLNSLGAGQYADQVGHGHLPADPSAGGGLSALYSSPQRPPLRALLGNVRRLSRDQVGCRLLQQALDEDGPSAATAILTEGLTFWAEAMVDPFGNYLFQKILERITPEERVTLVKSVSTRLVNASLNLHGTRSVQKIVEVCAVDEEQREEEEEEEEENRQKLVSGEEDKESVKDHDVSVAEDVTDRTAKTKKNKRKDTAAKILTDALRPSAARLCIDSHGNHAIQRILLKLPYQYTQFIFDAVAASVEDVARHRHGCCVIQRCLDSRHSAARTHLVGRIVEKSLELMQDAYGNYVVQYVLDVCGDEEVHAICESVIGKVCLLAIQKFSSNVIEKCLERCTDRVREEYLQELNDSDRIRELMMDPFGNYVVQRALSVSTHAQAIRLVETMKPHLSTQNGGGIRNTAGGRRILGKICRRFPNFALEGETFEDYDLNQVLGRGNSPHHPHGGGGGGRRGGSGGQNNQFGVPHIPGQSPNQRRNGRGNRNHHQHNHHHQPQHNTIPQYQQQQVQPPQQPVGHHVNMQTSDMNAMPAYNANPYLFPS